MFEERARIFRDGAYGFVDACGRTVIEPEYFWADDFREGRAAVQRFDGLMGLIDKTGREIIPAQYDIVEYDVQSGRSWVAGAAVGHASTTRARSSTRGANANNAT